MKRLILLISPFLLSLSLHGQNIGIGTTSPDYTLDINGTLGVNEFIYHNDDDNGDTWIGFPGNDSFEIVVGGRRMALADGVNSEFIFNPDSDDTKFIIVADGIEHLMIADPVSKMIGIGTSNPQYILDVGGDFRVIGDQVEHLFFVDATNDKIGIGTSTPAYLVDVSGDFRVVGDAIDHLFFVDVSSGKVGVGTSTPEYSLDVNGIVSSDNLRVSDNPLPFLRSVRTGNKNSLFNASGNSAHTITVQFIPPFTSSPNVLGTVENISIESENVYINSLRSVTPTQAVFNIDILASGNPSDSIKLTWMAWE